MTYWRLKGRELVNCNCEYGCNCQFSGLPDKGGCQAVFAMEIQEGIHGDTDLSGLKIAAVFAWPGAIHEGKGEAVAFVDVKANAAQRQALLSIMTGGDTDPMATVFAVFASTIETMHEPLFVAIDLEVDVGERRGRLRIADHVQTDAEPIRNAATGKPVRAQIWLEDGFEYEVAEIASGSSRTHAPLRIEHSNSYSQLANLHLDRHGIVRAA
jgi:hypothetical protein